MSGKKYLHGVKGFRPNMISSPKEGMVKQYTENTVFEEEGGAICGEGMIHYVIEPLEVFNHYPPCIKGEKSEYTVVQALEEPVADGEGKFASKKIMIGDKINVDEIIKMQKEYVNNLNDSGYFCYYVTNTTKDNTINNSTSHSVNSGGIYSINKNYSYSHCINEAGDYSINFSGANSINRSGEHSVNYSVFTCINEGGDFSVNISPAQCINQGGYKSINCGGMWSFNEGLESSINKGGEISTNIGGDYSVNIGDKESKIKGGKGSINKGEIQCDIQSDNNSVNVGTNYCKFNIGESSIAVGGTNCQFEGGANSIIIGQMNSVYKGDLHSIFIQRNDLSATDKIIIGIVDGDKILPNKPYVIKDGKFVIAEQDGVRDDE